ncbi:MAG: hypothetical protein M1820_008931 [Bogoriella megaspora]|nr:MAG: hypothetical protein M1820_008931 [Bogoriella megaspora]
MPGRLQDKIAIITGSSSGLGRSIALHFASEGATIVCSDLQPTGRQIPSTSASTNSNEATHDLINSEGRKAIFFTCNVTIAEDVERLVNDAVKEYGRVDIFVNNAGVGVPGGIGPKAVWDMPDDTWDATYSVNVRGVFLGCKFASRQMRKQEPHSNGDRGWIVNIASMLGLIGDRNLIAYSSSKHAVVGITKCAALDCAADRIHVNAVCPGWVHTAINDIVLSDPAVNAVFSAKHPFKGLGTVEDVAKMVLFLASEDAGWMTGAAVPLDGGATAQ